ncbi:MAG: ATP-binding protein [Phenylobacterium sp.]|jgi:signal transduction histidine kinase/ActR/RegA family two-component response regulator|uniref:ATP-binding protein n=1 Tax=Phenylobacterium sp. TaxID=1871053 RepID=UPI002A25EFC3|nr:ATP-binding protein [Phenylobacterium sp.]MDD3838574.1 ATP-binding protein [Phenylobacterium sp.]MDX9997843.1 ATP-binding protein [Phenylobacterium sp.]
MDSLDAEQRRSAETSETLNEQRLRRAIDVLPDGIVILDEERRYVLWNRRYAEIYHHSADLFAPGKKFEDTLRVGVARGAYPEAAGREEAWLAERLTLLNAPAGRHEQQLTDGRWILIEEHKTVDNWVVGVRVDITEMKQKAQALEAALVRVAESDRAKTRFLATMSHEIRTPLNGVIGIADVLSRTGLSAEQQELVGAILDSARTLNHLLSDILEFSRLDAAKVALTREPLDVAELARRSAALFAPSAQAKGLALSVDVETAPALAVVGDRARLGQILNNLLSNAVKFTDKGEIRLSVRGETRGDQAALTFTVSDTGVGFSPEECERLFRAFEQADTSTTRRHGGTGLGLTICRQLTELMGGRLTATSTPGEGSQFRLEVELPVAQAPARAAEADEGPTARAWTRPPRVLLAEDNPTNRKVVQLMLGGLDLQLDWVEDGAAAVEAAGREAYDLILMDLHMPRMDGLEAIAEIRRTELRNGRARTPIVVLSADVDDAQRLRTAAVGADDHLGKPIRADELLGCLARQLCAAPEDEVSCASG